MGLLEQFASQIFPHSAATSGQAVAVRQSNIDDLEGDAFGVMPTGKTPPRKGTSAFLNAYSTMPWLRAVTGKISQEVAVATWQLFVARGPTGEAMMRRDIRRAHGTNRHMMIKQASEAGDLEALPDHPLLDLIADPNPVLEGVAVRRLTQVYIDTIGETYWVLEGNALGMPIAAWPLPPSWVLSTPTASRPVYEVNMPGFRGDIPAEIVIPFVDPDPAQPYKLRGSGIGYSLADEFEISEFAAKHAKTVFYNSARPDMVVSLEGRNRAEVSRFEKKWIDEHQGFWRAFKPLFTNSQMKIHEIGSTFNELQFTDIRKQERDFIIQTFGAPPEWFGIIESSNRATIDAADFMVARYLITPRLELLRSIFQERLVPLFDDRLIIDYVSPVAEDKEHQLAVAKAAPWAQSVDEWREMMGRDPKPDGDGEVHMVPFTLSPQRTFDDDAEEPPAPEPVPLIEPVPDDDDEPIAAAPGGILYRPADLPPGKSIDDLLFDAVQRKVDRDFLPESIEVGRVGHLKADPRLRLIHSIADREGEKLERDFVEITEAHQAGVSEGALDNALVSGSVEAAIDACDTQGLAVALWGRTFTPAPARHPFTEEDALLRFIGASLDLGGEAAAEELRTILGIDFEFQPANPRSVAWARERAAELVREVTEGTRAAVRAAVVRAIEDRVPPQTAAREIRSLIGLTSRQAASVQNVRAAAIADGLPASVVEARGAAKAAELLRFRANMIARTETLRAANVGQRLLWEAAVADAELPKDQRREWLTAEDERVDDELCLPMNGITAEIGKAFETPLGPVMEPPLHPNCRCATVLVFDE